MKSNYFYYRKQILMQSKPQDGNWREVGVALFKRKTKDLINMQFTKYQQCRLMNFAEMVENLIAISWTCSYFEYFLWYLSLYFFLYKCYKNWGFFFRLLSYHYICVNDEFVIKENGKKTYQSNLPSIKCSIDLKVVFLWVGSSL